MVIGLAGLRAFGVRVSGLSTPAAGRIVVGWLPGLGTLGFMVGLKGLFSVSVAQGTSYP